MEVENIQMHLTIDKLDSRKRFDLKAVDWLERNMTFTVNSSLLGIHRLELS